MMNVFFDLVVVVGELDLALVFCETLYHYPQLLIIRRAIKLKLINLLGNVRQQARLRLLAKLLQLERVLPLLVFFEHHLEGQVWLTVFQVRHFALVHQVD